MLVGCDGGEGMVIVGDIIYFFLWWIFKGSMILRGVI